MPFVGFVVSAQTHREDDDDEGIFSLQIGKCHNKPVTVREKFSCEMTSIKFKKKTVF